MNKKALIAVAIAMAVVTVALLCWNRARQHGDQTIRIGVMLSLTGDSANYGKRSLNGLTWAVDQINSP